MPPRRVVPFTLALALACAHAPETPVNAGTPQQAFEALSADYLERSLPLWPTDATQLGDHRYDGRWPDVSQDGDTQRQRFEEEILGRLEAIRRDSLTAESRVDADMLENQLRYSAFSRTELHRAELQPLYYTGLIGEGLDPLVNREFATRAERAQSLAARLDGIPAVLSVARVRLTRPSRIQTETAIHQTAGLLGLTEKDLPEQFKDIPAVPAAAGRAAAALRHFQAFLKDDLLARSDGSFRIGRERFTAKLRFVLDDQMDPDAIARSARALLDRTQEEMVATAKEVWAEDRLGPVPSLSTQEQRRAFVRSALDHLAKQAPSSQSILGDSRTWLEKATVFVRTKDLVRVPDEPLRVVEMPEYRRGVGVAYCDSSGPLEPKPETFFAISPPPSDWPPKRVQSFFREYNESMLADLTVHEAMPGHYLQIMHSNAYPSKLRAVLGSGPFVEGWAVYTEWLMASKGFGGAKVKLQQQKMILRTTANALLDHGIHAGDMDEKQAMELMTRDAFQEEGEAAGKWNRARLTSAQLTTYFYGYSEMVKLRDAAQGAPGFSERAYHDRLLSHGSPGMRYMRQLMASPGS
ncbi:MAG TPA: DUF885 domain-containing protein [Myxococcaceae bacterium]|jgi:uncharacterized protein (DUF885 family)